MLRAKMAALKYKTAGNQQLDVWVLTEPKDQITRGHKADANKLNKTEQLWLLREWWWAV